LGVRVEVSRPLFSCLHEHVIITVITYLKIKAGRDSNTTAMTIPFNAKDLEHA